MNVLILGNGSLVRRRVLPSLASLAGITAVHLASRHPFVDDSPWVSGSRIVGYQAAVDQVKPDLVYVSLPNSEHHPWAHAALRAGAHVVVDKPSFLTAAQASEIAELADRAGLMCAEASVWQIHPMLSILDDLRMAEGKGPMAATAWFTSPPLDTGNFRLDPRMGGGIVYDRGIYAIGAGRRVFHGEPVGVSCVVTEWDEALNVDLSCRITLQYEHGSFDGFYSLKADYRNTLTVLGETYSVDFDRVFTPPDNHEGPAIVRKGGSPSSVITPPANTFAIFMEHVLASVRDGTHAAFTRRMAMDARIMDDILASAGVPRHSAGVSAAGPRPK